MPIVCQEYEPGSSKACQLDGQEVSLSNPLGSKHHPFIPLQGRYEYLRSFIPKLSDFQICQFDVSHKLGGMQVLGAKKNIQSKGLESNIW